MSLPNAPYHPGSTCIPKCSHSMASLGEVKEQHLLYSTAPQNQSRILHTNLYTNSTFFKDNSQQIFNQSQFGPCLHTPQKTLQKTNSISSSKAKQGLKAQSTTNNTIHLAPTPTQLVGEIALAEGSTERIEDIRKRRHSMDTIDFTNEWVYDIPSFLRLVRLHKYTPLFQKLGLPFEKLLKMDDKSLIGLGITMQGARRRLSIAIEKYNEFRAELSGLSLLQDSNTSKSMNRPSSAPILVKIWVAPTLGDAFAKSMIKDEFLIETICEETDDGNGTLVGEDSELVFDRFESEGERIIESLFNDGADERRYALASGEESDTMGSPPIFPTNSCRLSYPGTFGPTGNDYSPPLMSKSYTRHVSYCDSMCASDCYASMVARRAGTDLLAREVQGHC